MRPELLKVGHWQPREVLAEAVTEALERVRTRACCRLHCPHPAAWKDEMGRWYCDNHALVAEKRRDNRDP